MRSEDLYPYDLEGPGWSMHDVKDEEQLDIYRLIRMDPDQVSLLECKLNSNSTKCIPLGWKGTCHSCLSPASKTCTGSIKIRVILLIVPEKFMEIKADEFIIFQMDQWQKKINNTNTKPVSLTPHLMTPQLPDSSSDNTLADSSSKSSANSSSKSLADFSSIDSGVINMKSQKEYEKPERLSRGARLMCSLTSVNLRFNGLRGYFPMMA